MRRDEKQAAVKEIVEVMTESAVVVVLHYRGLNVVQMTQLRSRLIQVGGALKVAKNSLARRAVAEVFQGGDESGRIVELFQGPSAIAYGPDPISAPKAIRDFARENESLAIIGGFVGQKPLDEAGVRQLAETPSLEESRARLVGLFRGPASRVVSVLQAPAARMARLLSQATHRT